MPHQLQLGMEASEASPTSSPRPQQPVDVMPRRQPAPVHLEAAETSPMSPPRPQQPVDVMFHHAMQGTCPVCHRPMRTLHIYHHFESRICLWIFQHTDRTVCCTPHLDLVLPTYQ